jgi:hypothetical protein
VVYLTHGFETESLKSDFPICSAFGEDLTVDSIMVGLHEDTRDPKKKQKPEESGLHSSFQVICTVT